MLSGLNFRALGIAWVIDIVGSTVIGIIALVIVLFSTQVDAQDLADEAFLMGLLAAGIAVTLSSIRQMSESLPPWLIYGGMVFGVVLGYAGGWLRLGAKRSAGAAP